MRENASHLLHPGFQLSLIGAIRNDQGVGQKEMANRDLGPVPVLHAGRADVDAEKQALGIRQEMAFMPFDFLSPVVATAARPDGIGTFDALTVDDGRAGRGVFSD